MFHDAALYDTSLFDFGFQVAVMSEEAPDLFPLAQRLWLSGDDIDLLDRGDYSSASPSVVDDVFTVDAALQFSAATVAGGFSMAAYFAGELLGPCATLSGSLRVVFGGTVGANPIGCTGYDSANVDRPADPERIGCADCAAGVVLP